MVPVRRVRGNLDTIGRKMMITATYSLSGVLLILSGWMFSQNWLNATTQTVAWSIIYFFASSAVSSAYLTVSEIFPLEIRGLAIAIFYAFGTLAGAVAPSVFGAIIGAGDRKGLFLAYCFGGGAMIAAAIVEMVLGVNADDETWHSLPPHDPPGG
jgi:MFS family permease